MLPTPHPARKEESATTKAGQWFEARLRGERLPEHEIPCELCGKPVEVGPYTHAVFDTSDTYACSDCIEEMLP